MPLKDKKAQLEYNRKWKKENKEKVKIYQHIHQNTYQKNKITNKYSLLIQKIQHLNIKDKAKYLSDIHGTTRKQIYKHFIIPFQDQIEKEIKKIKYYTNIKPRHKKILDDNWNYVKKWMTDRGCDCGENNITKLSFHHLDPSKKEDTIRKMCKKNITRVLAELKKGVVKCKNCHTIIHAGTSQQREETLINQYLKESTDRKYRYRRKNKLLIWETKKNLSCIKCGINDPVILLFHHINSKLKSEKICLLYKTSRGVIEKEIAKTTCLCHNCHEEFHYIYGRKDNTQTQLEQYLGKKVIPLEVNIQDYLPIVEQNISQFYNLPFLIA